MRQKLLLSCWRREVFSLVEGQQRETRDFKLTGHCRLVLFMTLPDLEGGQEVVCIHLELFG